MSVTFIAVGIHYRQFLPLLPIVAFILPSLVLFLAGNSLARENRRVDHFQAELWKSVLKTMPRMQFFLRLLKFTSSAILCAMTAIGLYLCSIFGCMSLAFSIQNAGAVEAGEHILKFLPVPARNQAALSLGMRSDYSEWNLEEEFRPINQMTARVYGENSVQMAHRYYILAERCEDNGRHIRRQGGNGAEFFKKAEYWMRKCFDIINRNSEHKVRRDLFFAEIAFYKAMQGDLKDSRAYFEKALGTLSDKSNRQTLARLAQVASLIGDESHAKLFRWEESLLKSQEKSLNTLTLIPVAVLLGLIVAVLSSYHQILFSANEKWRASIAGCTDPLTNIENLNSLVLFELNRGEMERANLYSIEMSNCAESDAPYTVSLPPSTTRLRYPRYHPRAGKS